MTLIDLPFFAGEDAKVDSKIAPQGVLKSASNVRFTKQGRIVKRNGLAAVATNKYDSGASLASILKLASLSDERVALASGRLYACNEPAAPKWRDRGQLPDVGVPERHAVARNREGSAIFPSVAITNGLICVAWEAAGAIFATVVDPIDWTVRDIERISPSVTNQTRPRVVAVGSTFVCVWVDNSATLNLQFATLDVSADNIWTTAPAAGQPPKVMSTALSTSAYDVAPYDSTHFVAVWNTAAGLRAEHWTLTASAASTVLGGTSGSPTIFGLPGERLMIAWVDATAQLLAVTWPGSGGNPFGGAVAGPNILDNTSNLATQQPSITRKSSTIYTINVGFQLNGSSTAAPGTIAYEVTTATSIVAEFLGLQFNLPASKVLRPAFDTTRRFHWGVNQSGGTSRCYLLQEGLPNGVAGSSPDTCFMVQTAAMRGIALGTNAIGVTPGNHSAELIYDTLGAASGGYFITAMTFVDSGSVTASAPHSAVDLVVVPVGDTSERYQYTEVAGALYLSGGLLNYYDGQLVAELGFIDTPRITQIISTVSGGGLLVPGKTYQYVMTTEWIDAKGQLHLSPPSDPVSITIGAGQNAARLRYEGSIRSNRVARWELGGAPNLATKMRRHVWRTLADSTVFYRVTDENGITFAGLAGYQFDVFYTDIAADTAIAGAAGTNIVLYTQGARGGLSGPLQHDPPPPSKYLWAGKTRIIVGGLETPSEVRWSKTFYPGEPVEFSEDFAFRKRVAGRVRGVAALDDTWIIFGDSKIWTVFGDGPDDSGIGQFSDPQELPSSVGLLDARSLLLTPIGLFFQARANGIYLLPRGGGVPVWIGEPMRDELEAVANLRVVSAVLVPDQQTCVFTITNWSNYSRNLVYHLARDLWTVDAPLGGTTALNSSVMWDKYPHFSSTAGIFGETITSNQNDIGSWFGMSIETHALRPGGLLASVRVRKVGVLGEYIAGGSMLEIDAATDDAGAFASGASWTASVLAGGFPGPFKAEWRLPVQQCNAVRFSISERFGTTTNSSAFALNGLTFEVQPRAGMARLPSANRA